MAKPCSTRPAARAASWSKPSTTLRSRCKTVADRKRLQDETIFGCEPKSLPYLLCQMNLLLHGLDAPQIDPGNALRFKLTEIGERDRVDVILTNPPFGGEEEKGIQGNFPEDRQTAETALLFLQLIMRKLQAPADIRRQRPARAAVVVPNGTLFGDGVCARIKEELLKEFNLHTIVRLPNGVFAPYTGIPTNMLFFDRSGPTKEVWYYEQPLPEGRKNYTKTQPMQFEEFEACIAWWNKREENDQAWKVPAKELLASELQPRPQEPARQGGLRAPAARTTRRRHPQERAAHCRVDAGNQGGAWGDGHERGMAIGSAWHRRCTSCARGQSDSRCGVPPARRSPLGSRSVRARADRRRSH